ncbi:SCO0930 family lipoprotein [Streptomyces longispororuber]|uniref:SCO0930 family lipoprotein n=1 Tax=Streptomyces longispororuber TaxID=68230 RepID=UPI0036F6E5F5
MKTWRSASLVATTAAVLALTTACGQDQGDRSPKGQKVGNEAPVDKGADPGDGYGSDSGSGSDSGNGYGADSGKGGSGGKGAGKGAARPGKARSAGQLGAWDSKKLGKVVTDSAGFTLYRFDKDTAQPPASNCAGACEQAWPVVPAKGAQAPPGVDASLLGEVTRPDGSKQLTLDGWPMYRYAKDTEPGDAKGQGVGGTWFAAAPDGKKARPGAAGGGGAARPADPAGLSTRKDPELGEIVVDRDGMTVYRFTKDSAWPMKSACTGACLKKWPVVEPVAKNDTRNILKKGFVTFDRPDGLKQQTIDCWPLYTFAGDKKPGDTNGQGVGGTWFAARPDGKAVRASR